MNLVKKVNLVLILLFLVFTSNKVKSQEANFNSNLNSFKELKDNFTDPPAKYRTAPFYVWNDRITKQQIDEILTDYKSKGIGGAFIHSRPGLITEFLSDEWNNLTKYAVEKGKSLGMQIWIYDENTYPSGNAGGHVPSIMPESNNQGSGISITSAKKFPAELDKTYLIILKKDGEKFIDITNNYEAEKGKEGEYYFCEKKYYLKTAWFAGNGYVDLLNEDVTKTFIETIMKGHEKNLRNEFGKTIPGIFTDEPGIFIEYYSWTPSLFETFLQRWGYDLKLNFPSLEYEVGNWKKVRHDYYSVISDLFINGFAKPYSEYCKENNLIFTGHFLEQDWPMPRMTPEYMPLQAYMGMPGIDILFNQYDESVHGQFGNIRMPREARSVANQMGRTRVLSETYGGAGWNLSFQDMKRIADWQFAAGINFVNQHLSFTTIKGWRKRDYPQSFSSHEPWWHLYKNIVDYTGRMSLAMSTGNQINKIMVLEPTTSAWMYYSMFISNKRFDEIADNFTNFINDLDKFQIEYDLGSEKNIQSFGMVQNGKFIIGERAYEIVVIPPFCDNLDRNTFEMLETFMKQGGKVVDYNEHTSFVDGILSDKVIELALQYPQQWIKVNSVSENKSLNLISPKDFKILEPDKIGGKLLHHRRKLDDGELILLTNSSQNYWSKGRMNVFGKSASLLDAQTGMILTYPVNMKKNYSEIDFEIPQCGSLLLHVNNEPSPPLNDDKSETSIQELEPLSNTEINISTINTLTIDYCDLKFDNDIIHRDIYVVTANDKIFRHFGFKQGNPWSNPQYKSSYSDMANFPDNSGFEATYHLQIDKGFDLTNIRASVEQGNLWKLVINGNIVEANPGEIWLDRNFNVYNIGKFLKEGNNELKIIASEMTIYSELESIYILGEFAIAPVDKGFKIEKPKQINLGSWKDQGLQMYSNSVSYSNKYNISKENKHFIIVLESWKGTVAEVYINGKSSGIIFSEPFELDITDYLIDGDNTIAVNVFGSLKNLLGPHHSKIHGMASPADFSISPKYQGSGNSYVTDDYGLFTDFKIIEVTGEQKRYYFKKDHFVPETVCDPKFTIERQALDKTTIKVTMQSDTKDSYIVYTTDGSDPTVKSKRYSSPLEFNTSAIIKAVAFNEGMVQSNVIQKHIVIGKTIVNAIYKNDYIKYDAGGNAGLYDCERGTTDFSDGKWQGFHGDDMDVTFELLKQENINSITIGFLEQIKSWIYYPTRIEVSLSNDGKNFKDIALLTEKDIYNENEEPVNDVVVSLNNTEAKYVRVFAKNIEKCPIDDPGLGGKAWLFVDEVIIR